MCSYSIKAILLSFAVFIMGCSKDAVEKDVEVVEETEHEEVEVGSEIEITGILINTYCYSSPDPSRHDESLECAMDKTLQGLPVAVKEKERNVKEAWILVTVPQIFADYMNQTVRVKGEVRSKGVMVPVRVELKTKEGWLYIM